jgi:tetratricopeptide (TPR) repeat protein
MYKGKFRDAISLLEEKIAWAVENNDFLLPPELHFPVAYLHLLGWNDVERTKEELDKMKRYESYFMPRPAEKKGVMKKIQFMRKDYWTYIAMLRAELGELDTAKHIAAGQLSDHHSAFQLVSFLIHCQNKEYKEAKALCDSLLETRDDGYRQIAQFKMGNLHMEMGEYDQAAACMELLHKSQAVFEARPALYPLSLVLLGQIYEEKGDTQGAITRYEKMLSHWKDADPDLLPLLEAKSHLAALTSSSTQ